MTSSIVGHISLFATLALCWPIAAHSQGAPPASNDGQPSARRHAGPAGGILFHEGFDDPNLLQRGWYDGDKFDISPIDPLSGRGSIEFGWSPGATKPSTSSGIRRLFEPSRSVYVRFYIRLSAGWGWSGRPYHPHLVTIMTTENEKYSGPAASRLTVYVEPWNGKLRLATQDIQNKDAPHGLTQGPLKGGYNGVSFDSDAAFFNDTTWHCIEAVFKLNSLDGRTDRPNADGVVQGWVDGRKVVDRHDVVLRSTDFPNMQFNQFQLLPYFGEGLLPHAQTLWIDDLTVGTRRIEPPARGGRNIGPPVSLGQRVTIADRVLADFVANHSKGMRDSVLVTSKITQWYRPSSSKVIAGDNERRYVLPS